MLGEGMLKGLAETAKNFAGSFVSKERLTTVQYPEERIASIENTRDFPFLIYDGADPLAGLRCVACQICEKECPPKCIYITKSTDKKPDFVGKPQNYPTRFDIDERCDQLRRHTIARRILPYDPRCRYRIRLPKSETGKYEQHE